MVDSPACDWAREDYRLFGTQMACVAREPDATELVWYEMEHGKCTVVSASATELVFNITVTSAVFFTAAPYQKTLLPSEGAELSEMSNYVGKAVAVALKGGDNKTALYLGTVAVGDGALGVLTGERIAGASVTVPLDEELDCVLDVVKDLKDVSAVGLGECSFSADGRIDIAIDTASIFSGAGEVAAKHVTDASMDMGLFEGLYAGTYDESGDYEIFAITRANTTHMSGTAYFSTRIETWTTDFAAGEPHKEECHFFVDPRATGKKIGGAKTEACSDEDDETCVSGRRKLQEFSCAEIDGLIPIFEQCT